MATVLKTTNTSSAGVFEIRMEFAGEVELDDPDVFKMAGLVSTLRRQLNLASFKFKPKAGGTATDYIYEFVAVDGREWKQNVEFGGSPNDPLMDFDADPWRLSEFAHHRPTRDHIVRMHSVYGMEVLNCTFVPAQ